MSHHWHLNTGVAWCPCDEDQEAPGVLTPEPGISECTSACGLDQDGGHWHCLSGFVWAQYPRRHRTVTPTTPNHGTDAT